MTDHKGLPVAGYAPMQSSEAVAMVNEGKILEERVRRWFDKISNHSAESPQPLAQKLGHRLQPQHSHNPRLLAIARTHLELSMMAAYKSMFQPGENRIALPEDSKDEPGF